MAGAGAGAELRARVEALTAEEAAGAKTLAGAEAAAAAERQRAAAEAEAARRRSAAAERRLAAEKERAARTRRELAEAKRRLARHEAIEAAKLKGVWRDWAGLPEDLLVKVAEAHVAQHEAGWAAWLKERGSSEARIQKLMAWRKQDGNCPLFMFAMVCKGWRKAQLKVGGPLRTRVYSDVIAPGSVALVKWALAEGCPRERGNCHPGATLATAATFYRHKELVEWLGRGASQFE